MARRKRKAKIQDAFDVIASFRALVNETFEEITGKSLAGWFQEFQQHPRELPQGKQQANPSESTMPLDRAYSVMGLPPTASLDEVTRNYRSLARLFHPDTPGGYNEAMVLLNQAFERIKKERGEK